MTDFPPLVSVIVPCYNAEKYLKECIDSILSQTLPNIEIICINDGSTDTTSQILETYAEKDSRITVINKENSGYGASMNRGLDTAKGKYIAILESDDFMDPNTLAVLTGNAEKTQTPVVKSNFYFYWSSPKLSNRCNYLIRKNTPQIIKPLEYPALFWYMPSIWSAIYRRDFLVKHGIRFLETPGASYQDVSFTFKVWACAEKVSLLPNAFVHYRQDNENSSIHSAGKVFAVAKEFAEIERFIAGFGPAAPKYKKLKTYETRLKWDSYIWNYWRLTPAGRKDFFPHFQHTFKSEFSAGNINPQYFFPWSKKDLNLLLKHPKTFQNRTADQYSGKTRHFWKLLACITENRISPQKWAQTRKQVCGNWQQ